MSTGAYVGTPTSYTPVEYIESTGTQYIDTGVNGTWSSTLQFISKFAFTQEVSSAEQTFIGNKDTSNQGTTVYVSTNTTNLGSWCGSGTGYQIGTFTVNADNNLDITFTKPQGRNGTYNGSSFNSTTTANNYTSNTVNIAIFSSKAFQMETPAYMKLYFLKIKKDGVLVRDFIPVLDESNVACLYDLVEGKFHYNKGTGTFSYGTAGTPVSLGSFARKVKKIYVGVSNVARKVKKGYVGVPVSYTPIEYIESSGTQYIDTGVLPYQTELEVQFQYTSLSAVTYLSGSYNDNNNRYGLIANRPSNNDICYGDRSNNYYTLGAADTNIHTIVYNNSSHQVIYDNVTKGTISDLTTTATRTLYLFAYNASAGAANFASVRIMYCKIKDKTTNTLIRDFIPVLDDNNIACLYEQVEGKFYYNAGTGTFTAGAATGEPVAVGNRARLWFVSSPTLRTYFESSAHTTTPAVVNTEDYILIAGGMLSSTVTNTVVAYNSSLVATQAPNLSANSWSGTAANFNGRAIIAGGKTANSGSSRTSAVNSYTNNLARTTLATLWDSVYECSAASNDTHFMVGGGTNYFSIQTSIVSYDVNFAKTTPTSMSVTQSQNGMANVGNYIVRCGGWDRTGTTDFYDNNNAKTTSPDPWGKPNDNVLGLALPSYAVFFGGATAYNSGQYSDCKAYDKNKVLTSFNMPNAHFKLQGFRFDDKVWFANGVNSYIYNDNLVMETHEIATENIYGQGICKQAAATNGFAIHHKDGTSRFNVIDY